MKEEIEISFREFVSCLQTIRLYSDQHPQFKRALDRAFNSLEQVLKERQGLVIGIVGEELAFEKEIFFELSKIERPIILYLKERGIERIQFLPGLEKEELGRFISFLTLPKDEFKQQSQGALAILGIRNISVGKINVSGGAVASSEGEIKKLMSYLKIYEESLSKTTNSLEAVLNNQQVDHSSLRLGLVNVMDNLLGRYQDFLNFGTMKRYDSRTFFHTLNVSILSMYFSSKLGFSKSDVLDIGIAALFHDIGKIYISRKIIQKPAKLSEEEFEKIRSHVIVGTEMLLNYVDALGYLPAVICFEHHLKYDLSGYPKLSFRQKPHIASLIVSICDVYDALSQRRGYKNDYPPKMIYELMMREKAKIFEPNLLEKFFKIMGAWPVGTIVQLSDGSIAVVREENEEDIFSPKVEVVSPRERKESIDLKEPGGKNKIEHSLNPLTEGKAYLPLV